MLYCYTLQTLGKVGKIEAIYDSSNLLVDVGGDIFEFSPLCCDRRGTAINMNGKPIHYN